MENKRRLIDIDEENGSDGDTALHQAVIVHAYETVELLIKYGADVNKRRRCDGFTPLMLATKYQDENVLQLLLQKGADPMMVSHDGSNVLDIFEKCKIMQDPTIKLILSSSMGEI